MVRLFDALMGCADDGCRDGFWIFSTGERRWQGQRSALIEHGTNGGHSDFDLTDWLTGIYHYWLGWAGWLAIAAWDSATAFCVSVIGHSLFSAINGLEDGQWAKWPRMQEDEGKGTV